MFDERIDEIRDRVARGHHRRGDVELLRGLRRDRTDAGDDRAAQKVGSLLASSIETKLRTVDALVNVTASICLSSSIR